MSWESARDPEGAWMAEPVFDPELDEDDQSQLLYLHKLLWTAGDAQSDRTYGTLADSPTGIDDHVKVIGLLTAPTIVLLTLGVILQMRAARSAGFGAFALHVAGGLTLFIAAIPLVCIVVLACALLRARRAKVPYHRALDVVASMQEYYILPSVDLDDESRELLRRAKTAEATISDARAYSGGLHDAVAHRVVPPRQLWELAVDLVALTNQATAPAGRSGPATPAEIAARTTTLAKMRAVLEGRVADIEAHAVRIAELDRTYRDQAEAGGPSPVENPATPRGERPDSRPGTGAGSPGVGRRRWRDRRLSY